MESLELMPARVRITSILKKALLAGEYKNGQEGKMEYQLPEGSQLVKYPAQNPGGKRAQSKGKEQCS